jgi:small subunit ribosomal protein S4
MIGPKGRLSRREGQNLFLKGARSYSTKEAWAKRQTRPGQHGTTPVRLSNFARQLREKQKVKRMYGMKEAQFRRFFTNSVRIAKNTNQDKGLVFLQMLESRLDNVVYVSLLAKSKNNARQIVAHRHVKVNGKKVASPAAIVNPGDVIEVSQKIVDVTKADYKGPAVPSWMSVEGNKIVINARPTRDQIDQMIKESLIVELYSR